MSGNINDDIMWWPAYTKYNHAEDLNNVLGAIWGYVLTKNVDVEKPYNWLLRSVVSWACASIPTVWLVVTPFAVPYVIMDNYKSIKTVKSISENNDSISKEALEALHKLKLDTKHDADTIQRLDLYTRQFLLEVDNRIGVLEEDLKIVKAKQDSTTSEYVM